MLVVMSVQYWLCDFEAFQLDAIYFPVEVSLLNLDSEICYTFNIGWRHLKFTCFCSKTFAFQYKRHGLCWDAGRLSVKKVIKAIKKRVKGDDVIFVKGDQKAQWLLHWFTDKQIVNLVDDCVLSVNKTLPLEQQRERRCNFHYNNPMYQFCAQQKCYLLLTCAREHLLHTQYANLSLN
jgi:hypothetical protein